MEPTQLAVSRPWRQARSLVLLGLALLTLAAALVSPWLAARAVAEDLGAPNARLSAALELLGSTEATDDLRGVLDTHAVGVQFMPMAPGIYARYSVARRSIEIDERWSEAGSETLAAVIAHEAVHARDSVNGYLASGGATACIDSEIRAFRASAALWTRLWGPGGKPEPADGLERQLNLIAEREAADPTGLEALIRQAYTNQCGR